MPTPNWEHTIPRDQSWGACHLCQHFRPDMTCTAYPDRIPIMIASGDFDHLVVRPGQVGDAVFEVVKNPTGIALRLLRGAARRGAPWAIAALARAGASTAR